MLPEEIIKDDIEVLREERRNHVGTLLALFQKMRECQREINLRTEAARKQGIEV